MPLATQFIATVTAAAALFGFAHGLFHASVSRTPNFVNIWPQTATFNTFTVTWDSTTITIGNPIATINVLNVFAKRCHSIEDSAF